MEKEYPLLKERCCANCSWYAYDVSVCTNGDSEHRADFTYPEDICVNWEKNKKEGPLCIT